MKPLLLILVLVAGSSCHSALAQSEEPEFRYTDEYGEEVFGPGYMPRSPDEPGLRLFIAQPNAGRQVPAELLLLPQDAFLPGAEDFSLPVDSLSRRLPADLPLLRRVKRQFPTSQLPALQSEIAPPDLMAPVSSETISVHYVFTGQGAGAIVELPCGVAVIDIGGEFGGGAGKVDGGSLFVDYLEAFFDERPQLDRTIDVLFVSHPHADHINGEKQIRGAEVPFRILNLVDNGQTGDDGTLGKQTAFREWALAAGAKYTAVELARQSVATGASNAGIDPFTCANVTAFWGGVNEAVVDGGPYGNPNNHSVLTRIDFGQASFLFLGDLQDQAAEDLLAEFEDNLGVFDVDVFQLSHHGAEGDTTDKLLEVFSPKIGIISMGTEVSTARNSAFDHGHPRKAVIDLMQEDPSIVADLRDPTATFWAFPDQEVPNQPAEIEKAIYGTGWEGHIVVTATAGGSYTVETSGFED